jgi:hypothetical protein
MLEVILLAVSPPKRNESYHDYVSRSFKAAKRNKTAIKGSHSGRGKARTMNAPVVIKHVGVQWRKHKKTINKKKGGKR